MILFSVTLRNENCRQIDDWKNSVPPFVRYNTGTYFEVGSGMEHRRTVRWLTRCNTNHCAEMTTTSAELRKAQV